MTDARTPPAEHGAEADAAPATTGGLADSTAAALEPVALAVGRLALFARHLAEVTGHSPRWLLEQAALAGPPVGRAEDPLLREAHHRFKNSLQILAALMARQASEAAMPMPDCGSCAARLRALGALHDQLQHAQGSECLDLAPLLSRLCADIAGLQPLHRVAIRCQVEPLQVPVSLANAILLVANESITNALKHAFPGERQGNIAVALERTSPNAGRLLVSDDGVGMRASHGRGGLQLVARIARGAGAQLQLRPGLPGALVELDFPA